MTVISEDNAHITEHSKFQSTEIPKVFPATTSLPKNSSKHKSDSGAHAAKSASSSAPLPVAQLNHNDISQLGSRRNDASQLGTKRKNSAAAIPPIPINPNEISQLGSRISDASQLGTKRNNSAAAIPPIPDNPNEISQLGTKISDTSLPDNKKNESSQPITINNNKHSSDSQPVAPKRLSSRTVPIVSKLETHTKKAASEPQNSLSDEIKTSSSQPVIVSLEQASTEDESSQSHTDKPARTRHRIDTAETAQLQIDQFTLDAYPSPGIDQCDDEFSDPAFDSDKTRIDFNAQNAQIDLLPVGTLINDRYEIKDVIGSGGFATVYLAQDTTTNQDVALKVMDLQKLGDPSYSERFFREARIASKLKHNNVVSIYDFGRIEESEQPFIAMELLHGHTLFQELNDVGPLSPKRVFTLFRPVLDALAVGHKLGIVHKDLKPENLYLVDPGGPNEFMKILDFGVARIQSDAANLTSDGLRFGTPKYLAPEYIRSKVVSPAIDVYQMALIISESLTRIPAVAGEPYQVMMLHCNGDLKIASFLLKGEVGNVFKKALAINPEDRYPDCEAFGLALDSIKDSFSSDKPITNPDSSALNNPVTPLNPPKPVQNNPHDHYLFKHNRRLPIIIDILLLLCIVAIAVIIIIRYTDKQEHDNTDLIQFNPASEQNKAEEDSVEFLFRTNPPGAQVMRSGVFPVCSPTPCNAKFKNSDLNLSQLINFELEGYESAHYELTGTSYRETAGIIVIDLNKKEDPVLEFNIIYEPKNAVVTDTESNTTICTSSPCSYPFDPNRGFVELQFDADGYHQKKENITKRRYDETGGSITISLDKQHHRPRIAAEEKGDKTVIPNTFKEQPAVEQFPETDAPKPDKAENAVVAPKDTVPPKPDAEKTTGAEKPDNAVKDIKTEKADAAKKASGADKPAPAKTDTAKDAGKTDKAVPDIK